MSLTDLCWSEFKRLEETTENKESSDGFERRIAFACVECTSSENNLVYDNRMDETMCRNCGVVQPFNFTFFRGNNEFLPDTSNKVLKSIYKQKEYLVRKLDELECYRVVVKEDLMDQIIIQARDKEITFTLIKKILTSIGHKQKYLQIPTILNTLDPIKYPPVVLSCHERIAVIEMFQKYIETFNIVNENKRKNLLNYHFVLKKIFQYNNLKISIHFFNVPKGKNTIDMHEEIWAKICVFNKWL